MIFLRGRGGGGGVSWCWCSVVVLAMAGGAGCAPVTPLTAGSARRWWWWGGWEVAGALACGEMFWHGISAWHQHGGMAAAQRTAPWMRRILTYPATLMLPSRTCRLAHPTNTALCGAVARVIRGSYRQQALDTGTADATGTQDAVVAHPSSREIQLCESRSIPACEWRHIGNEIALSKEQVARDNMPQRPPDGDLWSLLHLLALRLTLFGSGSSRLAFGLHRGKLNRPPFRASTRMLQVIKMEVCARNTSNMIRILALERYSSLRCSCTCGGASGHPKPTDLIHISQTSLGGVRQYTTHKELLRAWTSWTQH
jgi:hypothetical protein